MPEIKIVLINELLLHETEDPIRTKRLEERLIADGFLKNPVIVGRIAHGNSKFLLLDGVNRVSALKNLGFKDIVAQIADYFDRNLRIANWCHLVHGFKRQNLLRKIEDIEGVSLEKTDRQEAERLLEQKKIISYLLFKNEDVFIIKSSDDLKTRTLKLGEVVGACCKYSTIHRILKTEAESLLKKQMTATAALITPTYEKEEIVNLASAKIRLPSGVTRHIIPSRVLNLHVSLALLKVELPIEQKNKVVQEMISQSLAYEKARFYSESVFVFDE